MLIKNKQTYIRILFCLLLSLFFLSCIDFNQYYYGHDGLFHINRLEGIVKAFEDGQFFTKVYPYTNNGYGYAVSLFYCDILLYPFALIYKLGVPLIVSYILMIIFYSSFSIFAMMWASSKIFKNNKIAPYIATLLFAFCNYRILDIYVRNALGEIFASCFIPFAFYALYSIFIKKEDKWICLGISYAGIAVSHNISLLNYGIFYFIFYIAFIILDRDKQNIFAVTKTSVKGALLAVLLSSFYLFPLLEQTMDQEFYVKYFVDQYNIASTIIPLQQLLSTSFINGDLHSGPNLGTILTIVPLLYFFQKNKNKYVTFLTIVYIVSNFCLLGYVPIIFKIKFLNITQFIWRMYIFVYPLAIFLSTYVLININRKLLYVIISLFIITTGFSQYRFHTYIDKHLAKNDKVVSLNSTHEEMYDISLLKDSYYYNFYEMYSGEYLPPTNSYDYLKESTYIKRINGENFDEVMIGDAYLPYERRGTTISFNYDSTGGELLMMPLTYYKGYKVFYFDNGKHEIDLEIHDKYKQVSFRTLPGNQRYIVHYEGTIIQYISLSVSIATVIFVIVYRITNKRKKLNISNGL